MKKIITFLVALFYILSICFVFFACAMETASITTGDSGATVKEIQTRLKKWGFYKGTINSKFDGATKNAVIAFQKKNKLTADGKVGPNTAKKMGIPLNTSSAADKKPTADRNDKSDLMLLAKTVYGESRGEPYRGQVAVAAVVLNRVKSSKFPNSINSVVYQKGAFSIVANGQINLAPSDSALKAARDAMNGVDPTGGAVFFFNAKKTSNKYLLSLPVSATIGNHKFSKGK